MGLQLHGCPVHIKQTAEERRRGKAGRSFAEDSDGSEFLFLASLLVDVYQPIKPACDVKLTDNS